MKQRIITACVGLCVLTVVLAKFDTWALNLAVSVISLLAVGEVLHVIDSGSRTLTGIGLIFSVLIPFSRIAAIRAVLPIIIYAFIVALFCLLLARHEKMHVEEVAMTVFICILIPLSLSTIIGIRDHRGIVQGFYYTVFALMAAWMADTGAYFAGLKFGKHKMSPKISPKKTVEGAIGGAVTALVFTLLFSWMYAEGVTEILGVPVEVDYLRIALLSPVLTAFSILGDLSASVLKRQYGVKDYGSIMPGHGGIMDRFDSVLFVLPAVFLLSVYLPLIQL